MPPVRERLTVRLVRCFDADIGRDVFEVDGSPPVTEFNAVPDKGDETVERMRTKETKPLNACGPSRVEF